MDILIEILKAVFIGVVEGITEWLPISSTGHMILVDEFLKLQVSDSFLELFLVVIQIGAICAVLVLFFHKLNPFSRTKTAVQKKGTWRLWGMVVIGCIPAAIIGIAFDDFFNEHFYNVWTVAAALILYGIVFIVIEAYNKKREAALIASRASQVVGSAGGQDVRGAHRGKHARITMGEDGDVEQASLFKIQTVDDIDWKCALKIGCFQVLAIIPGTSRSGSTIIGGMLCGCSRTAAAEFTFFLAIPVMFGWGLLKCLKYVMELGFAMSTTEIAILITGLVTAFVVSILAIKFLLGYIKNNDFTAFGVYRIILGLCVIGYFTIKAQGLL